MATGLSAKIREDDFEVSSKLPQQLPACSTRWRGRVRRCDDRDASKLSMSLGQRLPLCDALGAHRQAVGRVLDVAARDDGAVDRFERGADLEVREIRAGVLAHGARRGN